MSFADKFEYVNCGKKATRICFQLACGKPVDSPWT